MNEDAVNRAFKNYLETLRPWKCYRGVFNVGKQLHDGSTIRNGDVALAPGCRVDHQVIFNDSSFLIAEAMGDGSTGKLGDHIWRLLTSMLCVIPTRGAYLCLPIETWERERESIESIVGTMTSRIKDYLFVFVVCEAAKWEVKQVVK